MDRNLYLGIETDPLDWVALRKESVDRNKGPGFVRHGVRMSLSARRAWIEIDMGCEKIRDHLRRSPQGERG